MCVECGCEAPEDGGAVAHRTGRVGMDVDDMADGFVEVAEQADVPPGEVALFDARGTKVSIANVAGTFYAFDDLCTHRQCSLSDGELEGATIACPCHGSRFDVVTGAVLSPPAKEPLSVYAVRVQEGSIAVRLGG